MEPSGRHFAFIRAINTGSRRLTNDQLHAPFHRLGFGDVAAYQAAGNITFRTTDDAAVESEIEEALAAAYGFEAPTFVRTGAELRAIVARTPFDEAQLAPTEGRVQVAFLRSEPTHEIVRQLEALVPPDDLVVVSGDVWFWLPEAGISTSELPVAAIERLVGPMTIRTLGTLERLLAKFGD